MKKALLIIDIQNDYFENGAMELFGAREAGEKAKMMVEQFRARNLPVVHIQHIATRPTATFFRQNTVGAEINGCVQPLKNEQIIVKNYPNSFRETNLHDYLQLLNVSELVICGMMTHMCVDATVRAAKDFGYSCTIVGDACATRNLEINGEIVMAAEVQKAFLAALSYFYADITTAEQYSFFE